MGFDTDTFSPSEALDVALEVQGAFHGICNLHSLYQLNSYLEVCLAHTY